MKNSISQIKQDGVDKNIELTASERKLKELENFFRREYFKKKSRTQQSIVQYAKYAGYIIGAGSVSFAVPFGYEFGAERLPLNDEAIKKTSGIIFAIAGTVSLGSLIALVISKKWQDMVSFVKPSEKKLRSDSHLGGEILDYFFHLPYLAAGIIATTPTVLVTH
jgi:hypothetical protein